jgi:hypothetical protein
MLLAGIVFSFTLTSAVPVWYDETFIVEYGRLTLAHGQTTMALHERSDSGRPLYAPPILGVVLEELAYRITAPSNLGPRALALVGAMAAASFLVYYLLLGGVAPQLSVVLGLAFLLDPLDAVSWRGARIDCWAFAFLFASLCAIRYAGRRVRGDRSALFAVFLGGAAAAAAVICWTSIALLAPLILIELWALAREKHWYGAPACLFAAGGAFAAMLVIAPFHQEFAYALADTRLLNAQQFEAFRSLTVGAQAQALFWSLALTPIAVVAGLPALFRKRNILLLGAFLVAGAFVSQTLIYRLRVLYLLPYLYVGVASLLWSKPGRTDESRWRRWGVGASALMLLLGVGFTLAGTTLSGLSDRGGKRPLVLIDTARKAVGSGPIRVFSPESDLYFAGRALGWQQFQCFDGCAGAQVRGSAFRRMMAGFDYAIFRGEADQATLGILESLDFRYWTVMLPGGGHRSRLFGWEYGPPSYGPYVVYKRTKAPLPLVTAHSGRP